MFVSTHKDSHIHNVIYEYIYPNTVITTVGVHLSKNDIAATTLFDYKQKFEILRMFLVMVVVVAFLFLFLLYKKFRYISKVNRQLERQKEEITEANKKLQYLNSTRDKLFSIISHDLRNPFASIVSFSRILKRDIQSLSNDELQELAVELEHSVNKINYLLDNLLHWSLSQSGKMKYDPDYIYVSALVNENIQLLLPAIKGKGIVITNNVKEDIDVWADTNMTDVIIRNLLSNAIKYVDDGGAITIDAERNNGTTHISVADNGVGINEASKAMLFKLDSMFSTYGTREEKGSGLGLILCKEFAERQGGSLWFESELGAGSTFFFSLPTKGKMKKKL